MLTITPGLIRDRKIISYNKLSPSATDANCWPICGELATSVEEGAAALGMAAVDAAATRRLTAPRKDRMSGSNVDGGTNT